MQQNKNITKHIAKIITTGTQPPSTKNAINAFIADDIVLIVADTTFAPTFIPFAVAFAVSFKI